MSNTGKVAVSIALVFASGVATAFAKGTPEAAKLAVSAPVVAPVPTTAPIPVVVAPTPVARADALPSAVAAPTTAAAVSTSAAAAAKAVRAAPKPVAAPGSPSGLPAVTPTAPTAPLVVPAAPATTTTSAPTPVRPVCTDTSLDHRPPDLARLDLEVTRTSRTAMIESYARCVADGGAIDPRHDDNNGDGDSCGGHVPTGAGAFSSAVDAQADCLAELGSRGDF